MVWHVACWRLSLHECRHEAGFNTLPDTLFDLDRCNKHTVSVEPALCCCLDLRCSPDEILLQLARPRFLHPESRPNLHPFSRGEGVVVEDAVSSIPVKSVVLTKAPSEVLCVSGAIDEISAVVFDRKQVDPALLEYVHA